MEELHSSWYSERELSPIEAQASDLEVKAVELWEMGIDLGYEPLSFPAKNVGPEEWWRTAQRYKAAGSVVKDTEWHWGAVMVEGEVVLLRYWLHCKNK